MNKNLWESWPDWLVKGVCEAYQQGQTVFDIALTIGRKEGSVRHKLSREGVYVSKAAARKQLKVQAEEMAF